MASSELHAQGAKAGCAALVPARWSKQSRGSTSKGGAVVPQSQEVMVKEGKGRLWGFLGTLPHPSLYRRH